MVKLTLRARLSVDFSGIGSGNPALSPVCHHWVDFPVRPEISPMPDTLLHSSNLTLCPESTTPQDLADVKKAFADLRLPGRVRWFIGEIASHYSGCEPSGIRIVITPPCTLRLPTLRLDRNRGGVRLMAHEEGKEPTVCRFPTLAAALATLQRELGARVASVAPYDLRADLKTNT